MYVRELANKRSLEGLKLTKFAHSEMYLQKKKYTGTKTNNICTLFATKNHTRIKTKNSRT
jgi:hypothetical protein